MGEKYKLRLNIVLTQQYAEALPYRDVYDCGERQTMSHLMTCDASNCTWADLAMPTLASVHCAKHWEEST